MSPEPAIDADLAVEQAEVSRSSPSSIVDVIVPGVIVLGVIVLGVIVLGLVGP